ncbi:DsbA family protein [Streptomyces sp. NBC_01186]|uniref:DsbA family oxidoreductase n=1 Tax=unclassified Streptomyces TaxID=2593676 RepID=UPI002DDBEE75|nr:MULTISPECIES: DsbA family protein [unclassified Streptomyces]WSB75494.1 DsbA family protein [Streptomyces sp. NBC_01775]WSS16223.1 DsbA family protein [Streptomyces sp. NBC_01186]
MPSQRPVRLDLVHDFVCARSYLAFTRARRALETVRAEGQGAELVLRPFQVRPDASPEGEPLFEVHRRDRGEETARRIRADTTTGREDGLRLRFGHAVFTNTFAAHHLLARAAPQGLALPVAERLFRAYFTDGLNIADPAVLARLAAETGVDTGTGLTDLTDLTGHLRDELARTRTLGSETGPAFFLDGRPVLGEEPTEKELLTLLRGSPAEVNRSGPQAG